MEMMKNDNFSKACVEILEIIKNMEKEYQNKIPKKLLDSFEENKNKSYEYHIDITKNVKEQNLSKETIGILSVLELKYWSTSKQKEMLNQSLIDNEKKYQEKLRKIYDPDNIFKKTESIQENQNCDNQMALVEINKNIFTKFFKKLKKFFHIN